VTNKDKVFFIFTSKIWTIETFFAPDFLSWFENWISRTYSPG
jgi:hypothetical protein